MGSDDPGAFGRGREPVDESLARRVRVAAGEGVTTAGRWVLIDADRLWLTLALDLVIFASLVGVGTVWPFEMTRLVTETRSVQTLFNTLLSGIILLVSIVVSINSVVLTQEVTSLGTQQQRIENSIEFRRSLEDVASMGVSPVYPDEFLEFILASLRTTAESVRHVVGDNPDPEIRSQVETYFDEVVAQIDWLSDRLERVAERPKDVLFVGLEYDYSWQIYAARRFQHEHGDSLSDAGMEGFDDLVRLFQFFATGREYFKTLYIKQELATLSKTLLYVSLPTIVFTSYVLLAIDAGVFPRFTTPFVPPLLAYVSFAFVVGLTPFVLLTAFVIRVAAVSERSLAAGPFLLRKSRREEIDWD